MFGNRQATDWGDAREVQATPSLNDPIPHGYPVTPGKGGPFHLLAQANQSVVRIGPAVDDEPRGQSSDNASTDDVTTIHDEDGVVFNAEAGTPDTPFVFDPLRLPWLPYGQNKIKVLNTVAGLLQGWIDFNRDGDWNDAGEQVFKDQSVATGPNRPLLLFDVPAQASSGLTFARFRFSTQGGLGVGGQAADGEVEDYLVVIGNGNDLGDSPWPYPTPRVADILENDGASHRASLLWLGWTVDFEADGQPSDDARGDDSFPPGAPNDEDGVEFRTLLVPGKPAQVQVVVHEAFPLQQSLVDAWIDFNADGDWLDAGEQILEKKPVWNGTNTLFFAVPSNATPTARTYARFRLSGGGGLKPYGPAPDGEVEDYTVAIVPPTQIFKAQLSAQTLTLSWPADLSGFKLQSAASIQGPWLDEATGPTDIGGTWNVVVATSGSQRFFRLAKP